jgi:alpha-ketoglutarate-dependent taurine dioxygenase
MQPINDMKVGYIVNEFLREQEIIKIEWEPKMLVILNNRKSLHARGESFVSDKDRILRRILLK